MWKENRSAVASDITLAAPDFGR